MQTIESIFKIKIAKSTSLDGDVNYSNQKFLLEDTNGTQYVLKIFPDEEEWQLAKEESLLLGAIGEYLSFQVPQNIILPNGDLFFQMEGANAKLLKFIAGDFIANVLHSEKILTELGKKIAELNKLLFQQRSNLLASRQLFWDIQHTQMSEPNIAFVRESYRTKLLNFYLDRFKHFVLPIQHQLRHSLIHGDLNDYNILVQGEEIAGFIDFGDCTFSPMVNDLAIAMTYMMLDKDHPFDDILPLLRSYHQENPLTVQEVMLLPDLITSRLCISLGNSAEKKHNGEDNEYVLISEKPAWKLLELWSETNPLAIQNKFLEATGFKSSTPKPLLEKRKVVTGKALGLSYQEPITMTSALFQYMFDDQGNSYLDAYNNIPHVGHSHPAISQAISHQIRQLNTNTRYLTEAFVTYSELLLEYFPDALSNVFYTNSGSEANDLAIRMARTISGRAKVAVLANGYHGNTTVGIEISSYKFDGKGGQGTPSDIIKLPLPNAFEYPGKTGEELAQEAIQILEAQAEWPAAFIAEPISGCGGQVPLASAYLKTLAPFLKQHNILLILDEVQTGFGRLGQWFWGFEMHDVIPDIVVLGKPMANGHPMAAAVTTPEIADDFANGMEFFSSFGGNPVSCQAAQAVLHVLKEEELRENALRVGSYFKEQLQTLQNQYSTIADVRGEGLFLGIEFSDEANKPDSQTAKRLKEFMKANYILTGTDGPNNNVIKIKPPLCFTKANVDQYLQKLEAGLKLNS